MIESDKKSYALDLQKKLSLIQVQKDAKKRENYSFSVIKIPYFLNIRMRRIKYMETLVDDFGQIL